MRNGTGDGSAPIRESLMDRLRCMIEAGRSSRDSTPPQPGTVEALAGSFVVDVRRIWAGRQLDDYLAASTARRHVWHCWMASERDTVERRFRAYPALALRRLTFRKARDLLAGAYGTCPPGLVKALGRCGPEARSRDFYRALVLALSAEPDGAKAVRHAPLLTEGLVYRAARLSMPTTPTISHRVTLRDREQDGDPGHFINTAPFPSPPWPGTERLRPLTSRQELRDMGHRLRNCMRSWGRVRAAGEAVEAGREAYYAWDGPDPGLLRFAHGPTGWSLAEWSGADNRPLSDVSESKIITSLDSWPGSTISAPRGRARRLIGRWPRLTAEGRRVCRYTGDVRD